MIIQEDHLNHRWVIKSIFFEYNLDYKKDLDHYKSILKKIQRDIKIRKLINDTKHIQLH